MIFVLNLSRGKSFTLRVAPHILRLSSQFRSRSSNISFRLLDPSPKLTVIPSRNFGRGIRTSKFADRRPPPEPFLTKCVMIFIAVSCTILMMDPDFLEMLGINIKPFFEAFNGRPYLPPRVITSSSVDMALEENKEDIHQFLKEQAALRALEEAKTDPEFCAILAGQQVTPRDPEEFEDKKKYAERIKQALAKTNLKAETIDSGFVESVIEDDDDRNKGFRNRTIIKYENRIRHFSTPDKVFRYFATYKVATDDKGHYEPMMTPEDFLRSITPGMKQPENLGLDHFILLNGQEIEKLSPQLGLQENSIFHQLGSGGLITFSDYIFLLTVLSTSRRHFEIAFKMFDLNGDGNVDAREFEVVANLMKSQSSMGIRHRDHQNTGSTFKGINSGLISFFFGSDKSGTLTVEKFLDFQRRLQNEILQLEFNRKLRETRKVDANKKIDYEHMKISEKDFADLLITYAGFSSEKKSKMLKRVKKVYGGDNETGVSLQDYLNFYQVLYSINDIDTALTFYTIAGAPIERPTMKHVAQTVAGVKLSDHIVNVVFVLFDENDDGKLSNREFVSVMKQRAMRGLEKPKDTGLGRIFTAMTKCAADSRPTIIGGARKTD